MFDLSDSQQRCNVFTMVPRGRSLQVFDAGWSSLVARRAHNPKVVGSNPAPATKSTVFIAQNIVTCEAPYWGFFVSAENAVGGLQEKSAMSGKESRLTELLAPTIGSLGFELWGLELISPNRKATLRLYIEGEDGVTVGDCATVSRHVSSVLDVEDPIQGEYTLEVSSPGVDRLLFKPEQYGLYVGEPIEIKLRLPFEGRRKFRGWLLGIEGDDVVVRVDDHEYLLPMQHIDKAKVEPRLEVGKAKSNKSTDTAK
jgi:ribosome maturation factor RimP